MIRTLALTGLALCMALLGACSSADPSPPMLAAGDAPLLAPPSAPAVCANHEAGCPCDEPGAVIECGRVKRIVGDYVWCSTGMQTCDQYGSWGKCTGDQVAAAPNP